FFEWNPKPFERTRNLRINFVETLKRRSFLRRGVVDDVLIVDRPEFDIAPGWLRHREPHAMGLEPPFEQPLRFLLLRGNEPDDLLVQAPRRRLLLDVGHESVLVFTTREFLDSLGRRAHCMSPPLGAERRAAPAGALRV